MGNQVFACVTSVPEAKARYPSLVNSEDELAVTPATMKTLAVSLDLITSGKSEGYLAHRAKKGKDSDSAGVFFYNCFFENIYVRLPVARTMFQGNVTKQGQMLASLLKFLVKAIGNEPEFTTTLQYMAMLHNTLGVTTQHYSLMGIILVDTVASCLCSGFTDDVRSAWITTYSAMMNVMIPIVEAGTRVNDQWMAKNSHKLLPEYRPDDDDGGSGKGRYKLSRPSSPLDEDHKPKKGSHSEGEPRNLTPTKRRSQFKAVPLSPAVMQLSASGPNDDGLTTDHSMESIDPDSGSRSRSSNVGRVSGFKDDEKSDPPTV